uniref:Uncharacterized protein n=1 Tax=Octactis speculum TaxID=3111310 RepID=A0A7S2BNG7_9STRA|mmetsp:Transcript_24749/g.33944  ORF Transcript_24749/g.33944 Transcript_24749/m.33944 type:complete len:189 (+) Transcript_24749:60-626(+)
MLGVLETTCLHDLCWINCLQPTQVVSAVGPAVCVICTPLLAWISLRCGNEVVILIGSMSFICIALAYLCFTNEQLGNWPSCILLNALMGLGRSVWESTNKAIYASIFSSNESSSAFGSMYAITGFLTFASLFVFPNIGLQWMCICVIIPSALMVPCYMRITPVNSVSKKAICKTNEEATLLDTKEPGN